jgi:hypothetical protein
VQCSRYSPCELPKDASEALAPCGVRYSCFFLTDDKEVSARAKMTENGKLTPRFSYLQDFVTVIAP